MPGSRKVLCFSMALKMVRGKVKFEKDKEQKKAIFC